MKTLTSMIAAALVLAGAVRAEPAFSALDNGLTDIRDPGEQAALLKELGYDGICTRPDLATAGYLAAMDKHGIEVAATYVVIPVNGAGQEIPADIVDHIRTLKGRRTLVWLTLTNLKAPDEAVVSIIRKVCDLAAGQGLEVVLYPHFGNRTDTATECERLRKLAERPNLGTGFNLCHFLSQNDSKDLEATLAAVAPHLKMVQVSGADQLPPGKPDWKRLIQPLGEGDFDVGRVLRALDAAGYRGPFSLQCFQIKRPAREHLATSMRAWRKLNASSEKP